MHFTYFISGVYFVQYKDRMSYVPPAHATGTSAIGWGISKNEIDQRLEQVRLAAEEGNEIGSHANGHFDGSKWTRDQWDSELKQFAAFVPQMSYAGFRAPELGRNAAMYDALKAAGYRYDTSDVGKPTDWPKKLANGLWEFPLKKIGYGTTTYGILSMDYNFFFKQTAAKETLKKGTPEWDAAYNDVLESYRRYFKAN
ncbi:MAG: polysaccharide deacetylase family protein [Patescibacteria group bacterium]